jgi:hypothetical protein
MPGVSYALPLSVLRPWPSCSLDGSSDMYGLGIHLGFYLQWYSSILASWLAPSEIEGLHFTNSLFVASTFLALIISTSNDASSPQPVGIYVTLLLTFGYYLFLIPLYVWRVVTTGKASLDPTRWPVVRPTAHNVLTSLLLLAVGAFQLWSWQVQRKTAHNMTSFLQESVLSHLASAS